MAEIEDGTRIKEYTQRLHELLDAGQAGDAVALFMTDVGVPAHVVAGIRAQPGWEMLAAITPDHAKTRTALCSSAVCPCRRRGRIGTPTSIARGDLPVDPIGRLGALHHETTNTPQESIFGRLYE